MSGASQSTPPTNGVGDRQPHRVMLSIGGKLIAVDAPSAALAARTRRDWSWCLAPSRDDDPAAVVAPAARMSEADWCRVIERELTTLTITQYIGAAVILHAGAVADDSGRVIVLVAASGVGKSTATLGLARRGLRYVTDETVVIRPDGEVIGYPKPLAFRRADAETPSKEIIGPEELGLAPAAERLQVARIVLLDRRPGSVPPRLRQMEHLEALLALIAQSSSVDRLARPLRALSDLVDGCHGVQRLVYSDSEDAVPLLRRLLVTTGTPGLPRARPHLDAPSSQDDLWGFLDGRIRRRSGLDIAPGDATEDGALVLVKNLPARLSPLGRLLWQGCRQSATPEHLLSLASAELGHHPDASLLLDRALTSLCDAGILARGFPIPLARLMRPDRTEASGERPHLRHGRVPDS